MVREFVLRPLELGSRCRIGQRNLQQRSLLNPKWTSTSGFATRHRQFVAAADVGERQACGQPDSATI
jgi:hypothetical protein